LASWNPESNFDRHDALGMLMLFREAKLILYGGETGERENIAADRNYLGNDQFFSINYDQRFNKDGNSLEILRRYDERFRLKTTLTGER